MQISHSRVECWKSCPYKYKLRYIDKLETVKDTKPDNALYLGTALHTGLETGDIDKAVRDYYSQYPVIGDEHIVESMKLEHMLRKTLPVTPQGLHEVKIDHPDFVGYIDLLVPTGTAGEYDLYDFKYSNHLDKYLQSPQLHLYKYFYEMTTGHHIRDLYYICVPKVTLKRKFDEHETEYRRRVTEALRGLEPQVVKVDFKPSTIVAWLMDVKHMLEDTKFDKNETYLCNWCEYQGYCTKGDDTMILPSVERRQLGQTSKKKIWIYGAPFSGKTTMLDEAPNPLNINTDGNINNVTMPTVAIKDEVTVTGRISTRKWAWEVLEEVVSELEKKQNDFKTIIIDLLDDVYTMCRLYTYDELGVEHESDAGIGKGWDIVRTRFLAMVKRITNLDYENIILVSHVDTSRDIMKKNGDNITKVAPALQEKLANKVAGMMDIVARVDVDGDKRTLNFKSDDVVFGGGRIKVKSTQIPLKWVELMSVYENVEKTEEKSEKNEEKSEKTEENQLNFEESQPQAEPRQRRRRVE